MARGETAVTPDQKKPPQGGTAFFSLPTRQEGEHVDGISFGQCEYEEEGNIALNLIIRSSRVSRASLGGGVSPSYFP